MNEIKSFVIGFGLSVLGISLYTHTFSSTPTTQPTPGESVKISLFKDTSSNITLNKLAEIKKQSLLIENTEKPLPIEETPSLAYNLEDLDNIDGTEDDEILNINTDDIIPIDFNSSSSIKSAQHSEAVDDLKVALLPEDQIPTEEQIESPWVVAKGSKHIKNKILLEENNIKDINLTAKTSISNTDSDLSTKVAERIKQSIIFPIPDEILSDENLTPTFVNTKPNQTKKTSKPKLLEKKKIPQEETTGKASLFDNISSWLDTPKEDKKETTKTKQAAPIYSGQPTPQQNTATSTISQSIKQTKMKDIGDLYEAMQETNEQYKNKKITPSELRLSFNPGRAEISGQTLRWLKAFSEKAINEGLSLQIRLDASASTDLQRKRLGLLYTIFTSNGINIDTIDTAFANIESDTFIIRTIKNNIIKLEN